MRLSILALALFLLAAPPAQAQDSGPAASQSKPVFGVALDGMPITREALIRARQETGLPVGLAVFFLQWPEHPDQTARDAMFPRESLDAIRSQGAVPCATWEPMFITANGTESVIPIKRIEAGEYDGYIREFARQAKSWGDPLIIRLAHEPNIPRYHWGDENEFGPGAPAAFKGIFKRVVALFREQGADNARFAFCLNAESYPRKPWNTAGQYFPGREFVDLLGMDGYNWGDSRTMAEHGWDSSFRSFEDIFGSMRNDLRQLAPGLPMIVFETASAPTGGDKTKWIEDMARAAGKWGLLGLCWFQVDKETDWRMRTSAPALDTAGLKSAFARDAQSLMRALEARP